MAFNSQNKIFSNMVCFCTLCVAEGEVKGTPTTTLTTFDDVKKKKPSCINQLTSVPEYQG